jgi:hypothetical protein
VLHYIDPGARFLRHAPCRSQRAKQIARAARQRHNARFGDGAKDSYAIDCPVGHFERDIRLAINAALHSGGRDPLLGFGRLQSVDDHRADQRNLNCSIVGDAGRDGRRPLVASPTNDRHLDEVARSDLRSADACGAHLRQVDAVWRGRSCDAQRIRHVARCIVGGLAACRPE